MKIEAVIQTFLKWIWRKEDYLKIIVSNRETQFISHFWKKFCKRIKIKLKLSTTWHSKTDEQTKNVNVDLKAYLRVYVNYKQNDWVDYLSITKFEANWIKNVSTEMKFFLTTKKYLSRSRIKSTKSITIDNSVKRREMRNADKSITKLKNLKKFLKIEIKWAQIKQKKYVNMHKASAFEFREEDMIMLNVKFQVTRRQNKSIDFKNLSSYRVIKKINDMTYELELFVTMTDVFSIFHSWLLHLNDDILLQNQREIESKFVNSKENQWEINEIMRFKINRRRNDSKIDLRKECLRYLVRWTEHDNDNITFQWFDWTKLKNCSYVVVDFHHKNSTNQKSHVSFVMSEDWTSSKWIRKHEQRRDSSNTRECCRDWAVSRSQRITDKLAQIVFDFTISVSKNLVVSRFKRELYDRSIED